MTGQSMSTSGDLDSLLPIMNRETFIQNFQKIINDSVNAHLPIATLVIDVDNFKKFNSDHGHVGGDAVLKAITDCIERILTAKGSLFRYGGDEFVVLLPNHGTAEAAAVAERIRSQVAKLTVSDKALKTTVTIGVATSSELIAAKELFNSADMKLLETKRGGRNRVGIADKNAALDSNSTQEFKLPRIKPLSFNPLKEAENFIDNVATGLQQRCAFLEPQGVDNHLSKCDGKTCLRIILNGKIIYSFDLWLGISGQDSSIGFYGIAGLINSTSQNASNAMGSVLWDKDHGPILELLNLSLLKRIGNKERFTTQEFLEKIWEIIVEQLEKT